MGGFDIRSAKSAKTCALSPLVEKLGFVRKIRRRATARGWKSKISYQLEICRIAECTHKGLLMEQLVILLMKNYGDQRNS